jgi:YHS domain-containing protein
MKKISIISAFIFVIALVITGITINKVTGAENTIKSKTQTTCPVLGGAIDRKVYTDYKGYRIYFCCEGCPDEFKKNPEKYMKIFKDSGVTLEKAPKDSK